MRRVELLDLEGRPLTQACLGQPLFVVITLETNDRVRSAAVEVGISSLDGTRVTTSFSTDGERPPFDLVPGESKVAVELSPFLLPGHYALDIGVQHIGPMYALDLVERILDFDVLNVAEEGGDAYPGHRVRGYVRAPGRWSDIEPASPDVLTASAAE